MTKLKKKRDARRPRIKWPLFYFRIQIAPTRNKNGLLFRRRANQNYKVTVRLNGESTVVTCR